MVNFHKFLTCILVSVGFLLISPNSSYSQETINNKVPKHLPIKVELLYDKEPKSFETLFIKVTNTGDKPIYYLDFILGTEENANMTTRYGISWITFGRRALRTLVNKANDDDSHLAPKKSIILRPNKDDVARYRQGLNHSNIIYSEEYEFIFQVLSFGDGTGFHTTGGVPFPSKKSRTVLNITENTENNFSFFFGTTNQRMLCT